MLALGYRSTVGQRIVDREHPLLASWVGLFGAALRCGSASSGVVLVYLTPFVIAYWMLGTRSLDLFAAHQRELLIFVAAVVVFPPLAPPGMPVLYAVRYEWLQFLLRLRYSVARFASVSGRATNSTRVRR